MFKFNFSVEIDETDCSENKSSLVSQLVTLTEHREQTAVPDVCRNKENDQESEDYTDYGVLSYEDLVALKSEQNEIEFKKLYLTVASDVDEDSEDGEYNSDEQFIEYVDSYRVKIDENDLLSQINRTHDLVPGKYEGGMCEKFQPFIIVSRLISVKTMNN